MVKSSYHRLALKPGTRIDNRYRVERLLGRGGFAFTYLATDLKLERHVAIKELFYHKSVTRQDKSVVLDAPEDRDIWQWALGKFKHEAKHLAKLRRTPNIVSVNDLIEENQTAYIVMNYVEGRSLEEHLRELGRPLTAVELRPIFLQILKGLEAVHGAQLLHRDIKPDNIYLTEEGQVILLDFGAARPDNRLTSRISTIVPHSHGYSPPEQYHQLKPTPASDIYSVAATMVRAITGAPPPRATEREQKDLYRPVAIRCAGRYPAEFLRTVDAAMALEPPQRPASVEQWRRMLKSGSPHTAQPPPSPPVPPLPPEPPKHWSRFRRAILVALIVGICVLGIIALVMLFKSGEGHPAFGSVPPATADSELQAVLMRMDREEREAAASSSPRPAETLPQETPEPAPGSSPAPQLAQTAPTLTVPTPVAARSAPPTVDPSPSAIPSSVPEAALTTALIEMARIELEQGVRAENYSDHISINNSGSPRDLERMTRAQLIEAEDKDNTAYSASVFKQLTCQVASYDPKRDTATVRQCFVFDRTSKAEHKRKLGLIIRDLHLLEASTAHRCIDQLIVFGKMIGYACRLSEADHADLAGRTFKKGGTGQEYASDIKGILIRDRLNFQNQSHRDAEDMEFAPYAADIDRIRRVPNDSIVICPNKPANYARILTASPVVDIFPAKDNSIIVIYLPD